MGQGSSAPSDDPRNTVTAIESLDTEAAEAPPASHSIPVKAKGKASKKKKRNKNKSSRGVAEDTDPDTTSGRKSALNGWLMGELQSQPGGDVPDNNDALSLFADPAEDSAGNQAEAETEEDAAEEKKKKNSKRRWKRKSRVIPTNVRVESKGWSSHVTPVGIFETSATRSRVDKLPLRNTISTPGLYVDTTSGEADLDGDAPKVDLFVNDHYRQNSTFRRQGPVPRRLAKLKTPLNGFRTPPFSQSTGELSQPHSNDLNDLQVDDLSEIADTIPDLPIQPHEKLEQPRPLPRHPQIPPRVLFQPRPPVAPRKVIPDRVTPVTRLVQHESESSDQSSEEEVGNITVLSARDKDIQAGNEVHVKFIPKPRPGGVISVSIGGVRRQERPNTCSDPTAMAQSNPISSGQARGVRRAITSATETSEAAPRPLLLRIPTPPWTPVPRPIETYDSQYITPVQLYNRLNDGQLSPFLMDPSYILMIDVRDMESYQEEHLVTAVHVSDLRYHSLDTYTLLVLYDDDGLSYSLTESLMSRTMDHLQGRDLEPQLLEGGYNKFSEHFPFLVTPQIPGSERERQAMLVSHPTEILKEGLYLGNGDHAENPTVIVNLGISHIVNISRERGCPFRQRLSYLPISLEDDPASQLGKSFQETSQYIHDALGTGGKVLVHCNLGVSRSATVVIAYLMFTRRWTVEDAHGFVKERRPTIRPNRGFCKQLGDFERRLFAKKYTEVDELWR